MTSPRSALTIILAFVVLCLAGSASGARAIRASRTMLEKAPEGAYRDGNFDGNGEWWLHDAPSPAGMDEWHMSPPPASMQSPDASMQPPPASMQSPDASMQSPPPPTYNTSPPPYYVSPPPHYSTSPPPYGGYGRY